MGRLQMIRIHREVGSIYWEEDNGSIDDSHGERAFVKNWVYWNTVLLGFARGL